MKKIVACLDIVEGKVAKGVKFKDVKSLHDPIERGLYYQDQGVDELVYYDIRATEEGRATFLDQIRTLAKDLTIPLTVGGGIKSLEDIERTLEAGADKVSISSAALKNPALISRASEKFGSERIMVAIDVLKEEDGSYQVYGAGGKVPSGQEALDWALEMEDRGAGEICINAIHTDGVQEGFDLDLMAYLKREVAIPLIASGGAGKMEDFRKAFDLGIDKALGASVFHYDILDIPLLKAYCAMDFSQLIPTIIQDWESGEVLMLAYSNEESFKKMVETGRTWFYSRSRKKLWNKGEESGNFQEVKSISLDCDSDAILVRVQTQGPACHTGARSCFFNEVLPSDVDPSIIVQEYRLIEDRKKNPQDGYTDYLFREGLDKILKKVGEEATETVIASKNPDPAELIYEVSDLYYHLNVLLVDRGIRPAEVLEEIKKRRKG